MITPTPTEASSRAARIALVTVVVWFVTCAIATAITEGALWDFRLHADDPIDSTWRLELAWRAWHGEWSGIDFHYPRGPMWQVVGYLACLLADGDGPWTLALMYLLFHLLTLGLLLHLVLHNVESPWARVAVFAACALLSNGSGIATFRAFLPIAVILAYAPRELGRSEERPWRSALIPALWTMLSALVSFDRLYAIGLSVAAMAAFELVVRARQRDAPIAALMRALRYGALVVGCFLLLALGLFALGGDPYEAVAAQRRIGSAYASHMATEWRVAVPAANVVGLFVAVAALAVIPRAFEGRRASPFIDALWLVGALPAVSFGVIRADEGHMIISMIPALVVLFFCAGGAAPGAPSWRRVVGGVLAAVAVVGWFGAYPANLAGHPSAIADVARVAVGAKGPDHGYWTEHRAAVEYAREHASSDGCLAVSADMTIAHPLVDVRGPTELSMRWNQEMKLALAEAIIFSECPHFTYSIRNYDYPGLSWSFGPDFVAVASRYELDRRLGVGLVGLRLRDAPLEVERTSMAADLRDGRVAVPGEMRVELEALVTGTEIVELEVQMDLPTWRTLAGGVPRVEWRFERDGQAVSEWDHLYQLMVGRPSVVQLGADPEAAENFWILGDTPSRERRADVIAFRFSSRGVMTPDDVSFSVARVDRLRLLREPEPSAPTCSTDVDLLANLREARGAYARYVSPSPGPLHFNLEPQPPNRRLAEVVFEVTPCADACFYAGASVASDESDGVRIEVHVLDQPERTLLFDADVGASQRELPIEVSLERWAGREVLLRVGSTYGAEYGDDYAKIARPRIAACTARRDFTAPSAIDRGSARGDGEDILVGPRGATLSMWVTPAPNTCFSTGLRAGQNAVVIAVRAGEGGVEHVFYEAEHPPGEDYAIGPLALFDFDGRPVEVIVDVRPVRGGSGRARIIRPRTHACGETE